MAGVYSNKAIFMLCFATEEVPREGDDDELIEYRDICKICQVALPEIRDQYKPSGYKSYGNHVRSAPHEIQYHTYMTRELLRRGISLSDLLMNDEREVEYDYSDKSIFLVCFTMEEVEVAEDQPLQYRDVCKLCTTMSLPSPFVTNLRDQRKPTRGYSTYGKHVRTKLHALDYVGFMKRELSRQGLKDTTMLELKAEEEWKAEADAADIPVYTNQAIYAACFETREFKSRARSGQYKDFCLLCERRGLPGYFGNPRHCRRPREYSRYSVHVRSKLHNYEFEEFMVEATASAVSEVEADGYSSPVEEMEHHVPESSSESASSSSEEEEQEAMEVEDEVRRGLESALAHMVDEDTAEAAPIATEEGLEQRKIFWNTLKALKALPAGDASEQEDALQEVEERVYTDKEIYLVCFTTEDMSVEGRSSAFRDICRLCVEEGNPTPYTTKIRSTVKIRHAYTNYGVHVTAQAHASVYQAYMLREHHRLELTLRPPAPRVQPKSAEELRYTDKAIYQWCFVFEEVHPPEGSMYYKDTCGLCLELGLAVPYVKTHDTPGPKWGYSNYAQHIKSKLHVQDYREYMDNARREAGEVLESPEASGYDMRSSAGATQSVRQTEEQEAYEEERSRLQSALDHMHEGGVEPIHEEQGLAQRKAYWGVLKDMKALPLSAPSSLRNQFESFHSDNEYSNDSSQYQFQSYEHPSTDVAAPKHRDQSQYNAANTLAAMSSSGPSTGSNTAANKTVYPPSLLVPRVAVPTSAVVQRQTVTIRTANGDVLLDIRAILKQSLILPGAILKYEYSSLFYQYDNYPLIGWRKEVYLSSPHIDPNVSTVVFVPPQSNIKLNGRVALEAYFTRNGLHKGLLPCFGHFGRALCICHKVDENMSDYVPCAFGAAGCGGWVHTKCIGFKRSARKEMDGLLCPLCLNYLKASKQTVLLVNKRVGNIAIAPPSPLQYTIVNGLIIEEYKDPHVVWGKETSKQHSYRFVRPRKLKESSGDEDIAVTKPFSDEEPATTPMERPMLLSTSKPSSAVTSMLSHQLFSGLMTVSPEVFNKEKTPFIPLAFIEPPAPPSVMTFIAAPSAVTIEEDFEGEGADWTENTVCPSKRRRYARYDAKKKIAVKFIGGWMTDTYREFSRMYSERAVETAHSSRRLTLTDTYKRTLLDEIHDKQVRPDTKSFKEFAKIAKTAPHELDPVILQLPAEDGGLRTACVSTALILEPSFLQTCRSKETCAFCMCRLMLKSKTAQSVTQRGTKGKKSKTLPAKVEIIMGAVNFHIHQACFLSLRDNLLLTGWSRNILIKYLVPYEVDADTDEVVDISCDLCSRSGGILYCFELREGCAVAQTAPHTEGWYAHVPCLYWLQHSGVLDRSAEAHEYTTLVRRTVERTMEDILEGVQRVEHSLIARAHAEEDLPRAIDTLSGTFDTLLNCFRCSLCASQKGIAIRCVAVGCTVRAHFLCASVAECSPLALRTRHWGSVVRYMFH